MGLEALFKSRTIYLDTNVFIYALEGYPTYKAVLGDVFDKIDSGQLHAATSELALAEALVKPIADDNQSLQDIYKSAIQNSTDLRIVPISRSILIQAAQLRATHTALKLPDAIHLATAQDCSCETLLTNDQRLRIGSPPSVVLLSDILPDKESTTSI